MKILKTITNIVGIVVVIIVAAIFVFTMTPLGGGIAVKIVKSGSMEPTIKTGSIVVIKPGDSYAVGDVVTFGLDTKNVIPTTHRIVSVRQESNMTYYGTKGDANEEADPEEATRNSLIGKVLFTVPYVGFILDFVRQPIGFIFLIVIPAVCIVLYEVISIVGETRSILKRRKKYE